MAVSCKTMHGCNFNQSDSFCEKKMQNLKSKYDDVALTTKATNIHVALCDCWQNHEISETNSF